MSHSRRYVNNSRNQLSDRDIMVDLINTEKHLSHLYEHAIMESTNTNIHNTMEEFQHDEHENAYTLFNAMQQRGWYNIAGQEQRGETAKSNQKSNQRNAFGNSRNRSFNNQYNYNNQYQEPY